jgi:dTDP-4-amino-4,6-dideoxyglucose
MKTQIKHLALFGGGPLFTKPLVVGQPDMSAQSRMLDKIQQVLNSGTLTNDGPLVKQFEARICDMTDVAHCVAVCNGTMALQIMAKACGLHGEVILPALTYIATPDALEWIGLKPIFTDVSSRTHTLDIDSVRRCITPQTSAIVGVHLWGNPCNVD